jgi:hypothetical protein
MKPSLTVLFILLFFSCIVTAQTFTYPALAKQGKSIKDVVPPRWVLIDSVRGDLNQDKLEDLALIFEFHTAVKEKRAYGDNTTELITEIQKPRILAVYFKNKNSSQYTLALQNNDFILRSGEGGVLGDPLNPMAIASNRLLLSFEGGSNWSWLLNYAFEYKNKDWYLAEAGNTSRHRGTGEMTKKQYNFLTKKLSVTESGPFDRSAIENATQHEIKLDRLRTFSTFKKPWTWAINANDFL